MPNKNLIDLTGQRFGRLEVLKYNGNSRWECKCDCGKIVYPKGGNLRKGYIHSCGCLRKEVTGDNHRTHGETRTRLYRIWKAMRKRCNNPNDSCYYLYGGRGITVCKEYDRAEKGELIMDVREKQSSEKRLIDANALISYIDECSQESRFRVYYGYAKSFIDDAPTIDAVPVVRCRDCKYHEDTSVTEFEHCCLIGKTVRYNDFCSYGERKEGAD